MVLHVLRALFVLLMAGAGWFVVKDPRQPLGEYTWLAVSISLAVAVLIISIDILSPRRKLAIFSGTFFGLVVGLLIAYALSFVVQLVADLSPRPLAPGIVDFIILGVGIVCCYLAISFILQTKDDVRFIIPYVEFSRQAKGARPILLDTNILIDGRIADIAETGMLESRLIVPRFVLAELQNIADSGDKLKRNRGRRGLDVLARLQSNKRVEVILFDSPEREEAQEETVDQKLTALAQELDARILTNDFNLNKVAHLRGVDVININDLANALKPVVLPGERMNVQLIKPGEESGQGVGYLEDGTMVVVEHGRQHLNEEVEFTVTSVLQTSAGKMIFGRLGDGALPPPRRKARAEAQEPAPTSQA